LSPRARDGLLAALVLGACLLLYLPVRGHEYVNFDDQLYVTENGVVQDGLSAEGLRWAFDNDRTANWHPLTWLSHQLDSELFGLAAGPALLENALLHGLVAALLLLVLRRYDLPLGAALFAVLLFALHPLRVESVAWVSERKDVLCGLFWMLALLAYARYDERPTRAGYAAVTLALALALLSKPMAVTLPFVLLLVDRWPRPSDAGTPERPARRRVLEKLPWIGLALAVALVTLAHQADAGATRTTDALGLWPRLANAVRSVFVYLRQTLWPTGLAVFYPHPALDGAGPAAGSVTGTTAAAAGALVLAAASVLALRAVASGRSWAGSGWLWFVLTLAPVIGIVQVGGQAHADRYTYLPSIGLSLVLAAHIAHIAHITRVGHVGRRLRVPAAVAGLALATVLAVATRAQLGHWRDSVSLARRALAVTEDNHVAHLNLGMALAPSDLEAAIGEVRASIGIRPHNARAHDKLGILLRAAGRPAEATQAFRAAVERDPDDPEALLNLGLSLALERDLEAARPLFERALTLAPESVRGHTNHGIALRVNGRPEEARRAFLRALEIDPGAAVARSQLAELEAGR